MEAKVNPAAVAANPSASSKLRMLAVDIGGTNLKAALLIHGELQQHHEVPSEAKKGAPIMLEHVHELIALYDPTDYDCIGISTAGTVDPVEGVIVYANENIPKYTGTRMKELMETRYGKPTFVQNDGKAAAFGELHYGAGRGFNTLMCIAYGTGIGGGVIANGTVHYGSHGGAGAVGHIFTHAGGKLCTCGQRGCYECYASVTALMNMLAEAGLPYTNGRQLMAALPGDAKAEAVVDDWILEICYGLVTLAHTLQPEAFILGGGIMEQPLIIEKIRARLPELLMPGFRDVQVLPAQLGNNAQLYGVLAVAEKNLH